jgi:hypothetical protein
VVSEKKKIYDGNSRKTGEKYVEYTEYWPSGTSMDSHSKARVLVFGYSSNTSNFCDKGSGEPSFLGNAADLVNGLLKLRKGCPLRPLLFVGHGLGGYLIKEVL